MKEKKVNKNKVWPKGYIETNKNSFTYPREIWVNTSEAEIQPAFSPAYEISKRLIGQLVSFKYSSLTKYLWAAKCLSKTLSCPSSIIFNNP